MKYQILFILILVSSFSLAQQKEIILPKHVITEKGLSIPVYDYRGMKHIFEHENDTTYVINFWATWCAPCVKELPYFESLLKKYQDKKMSVILVSLDFINSVDKALIPFLINKKLKSNVYILDDSDANTWINLVDPSWSGALPATVIYNKNGRRFYEKSFTFGELETEYLKLQKQ
jgi:thiol-disulfide isomerase/thioredoxin